MLTKNRIEMRYGLITLTLLAGLFALARTQAFSGLDNHIGDFFDLMTDLGFVGIFMVAVFANSTLLIQIPYTVPLLSLALGGASLDRMVLMGLAAGLGAGFGELLTYGIAEKILGGNPDLERSALFQWVKHKVNTHPRTIPLLVFVWAASILPDDTVIIPLAMMRYGIKRMSLPLFTGKVAHCLIVAVVFYRFTSWSADRVSATVQADLALGILILFVMMILYQVEKTRANGKVPVTTLTAEAG
jgi:hypothetical protein